MIIIGVIVAILMFMIIIIIHELGHFLAARIFGVKVEEFGLGIPPFAKEIFTDKKGTKYTLNWLPLGGFVRLKGENNSPHLIKEGLGVVNENDKFIDKNYFEKAIILLGGVFMNFLLAIIIFSILFFVGVKPIGINSQIETDLNVKIIPTQKQALDSGLLEKKEGILLYPVENSIAEKSGIKKGDLLLKVNNKKIESPEKLIKFIGENAGKELIFEISRKSEQSTEGFSPLQNIKIKIGENGKIGAYLSENIQVNKDFKYKYGLLNSVKYGIFETYNQSLLTLKGIGILGQKIFNPKDKEERGEALDNMKGPIGIVDLVANSIKGGLIFLLILSAIISINLGVFNLLPIPALDGGRLLLLSINTFLKKIFGDKINTNYFENILHILFFIILIALSLIIGYNDVINIINR
ncbi:MAG: site-2 protease family protein [Candidatus Gracilibacteria bacterium]|nr:site-2 protease family protein [Candidatus Gracilibacteria bacterium]